MTMELSRKFKGIWIPAEIWQSNQITMMEKIMLAEIDSLDNDNHCTASNEYFANFFDITERRVSDIIGSLIEKGYVSKVSFDGRNRVLQSNMKIVSTQTGRKLLPSIEDDIDSDWKKTSTPNIYKKEDKKVYRKDNKSPPTPQGDVYEDKKVVVEEYLGESCFAADKKLYLPTEYQDVFTQDELLVINNWIDYRQRPKKQHGKNLPYHSQRSFNTQLNWFKQIKKRGEVTIEEAYEEASHKGAAGWETIKPSHFHKARVFSKADSSEKARIVATTGRF